MRVLKFLVEDKTIRPDPSCDFSGLFPGKEKQLRAEFTFSPEWNNRMKVVAFWSILNKEYEPKLLNDGGCLIPEEALSKVAFKIQILGKHRGVKTETNCLTVYQSGGKK